MAKPKLAIQTGDVWRFGNKLARVTSIRLHNDCEPSITLKYLEGGKTENMWRSQFEDFEPIYMRPTIPNTGLMASTETACEHS